MASVFDGIEIKTFKISELHGKTLTIFATKGEDSGLIISMGYDNITGHCYVLSIEEKDK